jgi:hypothetical protein
MNEPVSASSENNLKNQNTSMFVNLVVNVFLPSIVLTKLSAPERLGPMLAFWLALSLPISFGLWEIVRNRKASFFAIFGLLNVALTGGLGLLQLDGYWFAVKEAAFPLILGIGVLVSTKTKLPVVRGLLLNENLVNLPKIMNQLDQSGRHKDFEQLIGRATLLFACSFFLSALLNFGLARFVLKSPTGSAEFNAELGKMTALSFPVIALPVLIFTGLIFWYLFGGISKITSLSKEEILRDQSK